ncbi:MAG: hypothetical protein AB2L24_09790 [Mangrovibacterium sp.]
MGLDKMIDGKEETSINFPAGSEFVIDLESRAPFTARSLTLQITEKAFSAPAVLQVKGSDGTYHTISDFTISRSNPTLHVGFVPYAPVVVSFPPTTASAFRLIICNVNPVCGLAELTLSSAPRVANYAEKDPGKNVPFSAALLARISVACSGRGG